MYRWDNVANPPSTGMSFWINVLIFNIERADITADTLSSCVLCATSVTANKIKRKSPCHRMQEKLSNHFVFLLRTPDTVKYAIMMYS